VQAQVNERQQAADTIRKSLTQIKQFLSQESALSVDERG
jgi:hypothetical protein